MKEERRRSTEKEDEQRVKLARHRGEDANMPVIEGSEGAGFRLGQGQELTIANTHGSQVVHLFVHNAGDLGEIMSIQHSRNVWYRLQPKAGDQL